AARRRLADRLRRRGVAVPAGVLVAGTVQAPAAVPPGLVDTTVRAATGTAGPMVTKLATEVTRAMLLTKLRAAALLVPAALVVGVGIAVAATGRAGPDEPAGKPAAPPAKAEAKADDRPAWRKEFDTVYALKDGEVLRRVAPPYPESRVEFWKDYFKENPRVIGECGKWFTVLRFRDGAVHSGPVQMPVMPEDGVALTYLLGMLDFPAQTVEGDEELLAAKVTGDFVLRAGADRAKVAAALQKVLADLGVPARLTVRDEERQVVVLKGKWASKPLDGKDKDHVELYSQALIEPGGAGSGSGPLPEFVRGLQGFVGRRVVAEVEGAPKAVSWRLNVRSPMEKDPATGKDTLAEDTEAEPVLRNVCAQTGLTFAVEARKVPVLFVERAGR
ncbi:MAG: hypothetical protein K2X82_15775, partial [Gemmataceae bacterium]|nr:hypothetical protein [Gemmataceae bacterium]